jgi:hypothetical protein
MKLAIITFMNIHKKIEFNIILLVDNHFIAIGVQKVNLIFLFYDK